MGKHVEKNSEEQLERSPLQRLKLKADIEEIHFRNFKRV